MQITKPSVLGIAVITPDQGPVRSMVSVNHWLSSININWLSWHLTLVSANQASSNSTQVHKFDKIGGMSFSRKILL